MSHTVCKQIDEWIVEEVSKPIEKWEQRTEKRCKEQDCNWWCACCNKWFCWLVTFLVKVVYWVVEKVGRWVVHTVCEIIADVWDVVKGVALGIWDVIAGIFTLDWRRIFDGLFGIVSSIIKFIFDLIRIVLLGDTIDWISGLVNQGKLRAYARDLIDKRFSDNDELRDRIHEALGLDSGVFGLRLAPRAIRGYVDSEFRLSPDQDPALILWNEDPSTHISLRRLAGFEQPNFWNRFRPQTVDTGSVIGGGGLGGPPGISEDELDDYITSRGKGAVRFRIYCMEEGVFDTRVDAAELKGREVGLIMRFKKEEVLFTDPRDIVFAAKDGFDDAYQMTFLASRINRKNGATDFAGAVADLCTPVAIGVFYYNGEFVGGDKQLNGLTVPFADGRCLEGGGTLRGKKISGVTFKDRIPDIVWKWVMIHELGHYFGLCHVDGLNRVMANPKDRSWWNGWFLPDYFYLKGEPSFILDEGKRVWDYIVANFDAECLASRHE